MESECQLQCWNFRKWMLCSSFFDFASSAVFPSSLHATQNHLDIFQGRLCYVQLNVADFNPLYSTTVCSVGLACIYWNSTATTAQRCLNSKSHEPTPAVTGHQFIRSC